MSAVITTVLFLNSLFCSVENLASGRLRDVQIIGEVYKYHPLWRAVADTSPGFETPHIYPHIVYPQM